MGDIVEFPSGHMLKAGENARDKESQDFDTAMESVEIAIKMFDVLEDELVGLNHKLCQNLDFTDPDNAEARDIYVITNLISSMLIRHAGIPHLLHPYMDDLYDIIVKQTGE